MYIVRDLTCTSSKPFASPGLCAPRSPAICPGCKALLHSENFRAKVGNLRGWHLKLTVRPLKLDIFEEALASAFPPSIHSSGATFGECFRAGYGGKMEGIWRSPVEVGRLSRYFSMFFDVAGPRWYRILSVNRIFRYKSSKVYAMPLNP